MALAPPAPGRFALIQLGFDQAPAQVGLPAVLLSGAWLCGGVLLARRRLTGMIARTGGR